MPDALLSRAMRGGRRERALALHQVVLPAILTAAVLAGAGCGSRAADYDPLAVAASAGPVVNREAPVPAVCYTKTGGASNPCWACHTSAHGTNTLADWELQEEYAFSDAALENHWTNLFVDRTAAIAAQSDAAILDYIRVDNYTPLRRALLARAQGFKGYIPDLDLSLGFDDDGFARDGSGWRAVRYKPFPGGFWPTNGSSGDVFIRLPAPFRTGADGRPSRAVYALNLALLETAIAADPAAPDGALNREVEPLDERIAGLDLDGDGAITSAVTTIQRLPPRYSGAAGGVAVRRYLYPKGVEFLHSVRYLDPDRPSLLAARMKELRYARKVMDLDGWGLLRAYEKEHDDKDEGTLPVFAGSATSGLRNDFGWQLQGFIEDGEGRLRLQTEEEHVFCMGCHSGVGVTVDATFSFARKVPGLAGFRHQDLRGIPDVPQVGHSEPETLTYFRRVGAGDDLRANQEIVEKFFRNGELDASLVLRAAPGGDRDMAFLVAPSRERAMLLNKAYRALVLTQRFDRGRDALPSPAMNVHPRIENGSTELSAQKRIFRDGRLQLSWPRGP
jgi:hypothetical protein